MAELIAEATFQQLLSAMAPRPITSAARRAGGAYRRLAGLITELRDALNPDLDVDAAATLTWSAVHGLAVLSPGLADVARKTNTRTGPLDELIEQFTDLLINGFAARRGPGP